MQRICITFLLLFVFSFASKAQVAIGTTNIPNSALLYLESTYYRIIDFDGTPISH